MRVLVTGAAGRLGHAVTQVLVAEGHTVTATDTAPRDGLPVPLVLADLRLPEQAHAVVKGHDAVIHLANLPGFHRRGEELGFIDNLALNVNVAEACIANAVPTLIWASSIQVIGSGPAPAPDRPCYHPYLPLDSATPPNPGNLYAASKHCSEQLLAYHARIHGLAVLALRLPFIIPPGGRPMFDAAEPVGYGVNEGCAYLHARDAGHLCHALLRHRHSGYRVYLPASPRPMCRHTIPELLDRYYRGIPWRDGTAPRSLICGRELLAEFGWQAAE